MEKDHYTLDDVPENIRRGAQDAAEMLGSQAVVRYVHEDGTVREVDPIEGGARCPVAHQMDNLGWAKLALQYAVRIDSPNEQPE